ncbi:Serine/threonine protein kinase [Parafrankia irregularis]|uniref:Serine/threonine protein kinase n=1 Tax=Parafrankia irregularis TaxID=795642 RepID=A0A0S4QLC4_9ACTN|nr:MULTISPECIES: protein kinase [Parafrankia]MBE3202121.1 serine/threonine protein kinase [Parafrankia sp. CH37]CUU55903.1 Serine/threonine protein kinase [Parafrankia irregularis]
MKPLGPDDPRTAGAYRLVGVLGAGGMGRVYLGRSPGGRNVAIKVIRPEFADHPEFRARFRREVEAARRVGGRWTAQVIDADADAERPYLVTVYVPGPSLLDAVHRHGPLPAPTVTALGVGLSEALISIHAAGVVHRDLKPSNVLLTVDGPTVIDFGIARAVDSTILTQSGSMIGSPAFISPEQITGGDIGPASDVFALGAVLVFAATGSGPFAGTGTPAVLYGILNGEPRLDGVPAELRAAVEACLHKTPALRPRPAEIRRALLPDDRAGGALWARWLPPELVTGLIRQAVDVLDLEGSGGRPEVVRSDETVSHDAPSRSAVTHAPSHGTVTHTPAYSTAAAEIPGLTPPPEQAGRDGQRRLLAVIASVATMCLVIIVTAVVLIGSRDSGDDAKIADQAGTGSPAPLSASAGPGGRGTASDGSDPAASPVRPGPLPAGYAGTWEGQVTSHLGVTQQVVITLRAGSAGEVVGRSEFTLDGLGGLVSVGSESVKCVGDLELVGLSDGAAVPGIVLRDVPGSDRNPTLLGLQVCTSGGTSRLALTGDDELAFQSDEDDAGRPAGTLSRRG